MDQVGDWVGTRSPLWESCSKPNYSILAPCHMTSDWVIIDYLINFANEIILLHISKHFAFDHRLFLTTKSYIYDIEKIQSVLGRRHVNTILLCHAFTGLDTTSRIHGVGKDRLFRMIASIDESVIYALYLANSTPATIKHVGEHLMLQLISSKSRSLDEARLSVLEQKSQSSSADIKCEQLPPTSGAAEQHSYRVYHQLQAWDENDLDPISWEWTMNNGAHVHCTCDHSYEYSSEKSYSKHQLQLFKVRLWQCLFLQKSRNTLWINLPKMSGQLHQCAS